MGMNFKASWKESVWWDGKANIIIPPRSFVTSIRKMAAYCRISDYQYRDARDYLQRHKRIAFRGTSHWHIVTLLDLDTCEDNPATEHKASDLSGTRQSTSRAQAEHKPSTTVLDVVDVVDVKNDDDAWPLTLKELQERGGSDLGEFLDKLLNLCRQAQLEATDEQIAAAIIATDKPERRSLGLFLHSVPAFLRAGQGVPHGEPESIYHAATAKECGGVLPTWTGFSEDWKRDKAEADAEQADGMRSMKDVLTTITLGEDK
jgi:hypothetical protein